MAKFLNNINLEAANDIQFKTTAGANAGKIEQDGNNLVLSNAVGDVLLGDGSSDVYIGDGTNNVDVLFEQSGSIKGDGSAVTLTIGGANTTLNLENPNINGTFSIGSTTINNKLTFTTSNGYILFDHEPTTDAGEYSSEVPLLKVDRSGTELTVLSRLSNNGAIALGNDDTVAIVAGDVKTVIKDNLNYASENVVFAAEGGFYAYGFPGNLTNWSNRNELRFRADSATASENGLYIGDGTHVQFIDINRNLKNIGTLGIGTASPNALLNVQGDSDPTILINAETGNSANSGKLAFAETDGGAHQAWMKYDGFANRLEIGTAQVSQAFVINRTDGNVGIGTALPSVPLEVNGNALINGYLHVDKDGSPSLLVGEGGDVDIYYDGTDMHINPQRVGAGDLIIDNGNVGIGTTDPSEALDVAGNIFIGANDLKGAANCKIEMDAADGFTLTNPNNAHGVDIVADDLTFFGGGLGNRKITTNAGDLSIDPTADLLLNETDGNVGIGTAIPTRKLHLKFTDDDTDLADANGIRIENESLTSGAMAVAHFRVDSNDWYLGNRKVGSTSDFFITHEASELLTIDNLGNVGIGTTSPSDQDLSINTPKLHVVGPSTTDAFNLVARFQGGNDSDNTGAAILINHSNDRGLLINAGRADSDREVAYFNLVSSGANITNMLTLKKVGEAYNVGIKTTSPAKELDVVGTVRAVDTSGNDQHQLRPTQLISYATDAIINAQSAGDDVRLNTQSNTVLIATAEGNVGIGTTAPSRKFEIHENTTNLTIGEKNGYAPSVYGPVIETNANAITLPRDLYLAGSQANVRNISSVLTLNGDNGIAFRYYDGSSGQEGMRLTNAGKVGIGITSVGTINGVTFSSVGLHVKASTLGRTITEGSSWGEYIMNHSGASANQRGKFIQSKSGNFNLGSYDDNGTQRVQMTVLNDGKVGIGTTGPSQKLHVVGNTTTTGVSYTDIVQTYSGSSIDFRHQDASVVMRVDTSNARVGIGTTSPSAKLHVVTNNSPAQLYLQRTGSITGNYRLGVAGATNKFYITDVAQSQDRLVIDGSGNVTVSGNINVGEKIAHDGDSNTYMQLTTDQINFYAGNVRMLTLQESTHDQIVINENGSDVNFRIETDTESNAFYMDGAGSGNVGIGTSTPSAKMHVEGTIKAKVYTVATLPSASPAGQRAFVSDSYYNLQESHGSGVYGGGSYFCPVYSDGSNWYNG